MRLRAQRPRSERPTLSYRLVLEADALTRTWSLPLPQRPGGRENRPVMSRAANGLFMRRMGQLTIGRRSGNSEQPEFRLRDRRKEARCWPQLRLQAVRYSS